MKVIDSFSFFNETEILKLRLNYLNEVVDHFIISECNYTHSGKPKPYYLDHIIGEIDENILKKIIRLKYEPDIRNFSFPQLDEFNFNTGYWHVERTQRNFITQSLYKFSPNDIIMISDLDEIPDKKAVMDYKNCIENYSEISISKDFCAVSKCIMFYYNFHTLVEEEWPGTVFSTVGNAIKNSCTNLYYNRINFFPIENGGWHFSTFGSIERIKTKIQSFAHQEYNKEKYITEENISNAIQNKRDIYHNHSSNFSNYEFLNFPKELRKHIISLFPEKMYKE